jgi:hypothetical protein
VGILNPEASKPKGMNLRSFERLQIEQDKFAGQCLPGIIVDSGSKLAGESSTWGHNWGHIDFLFI